MTMKIDFTNKVEAFELNLYDYVGAYEKVNVDSIKEQLENAEGKPLNIFINSYGGEVFEGFAIYNLIKRYEGYKTITIDGIAASIASIIALSGDKLIMNKASMFMIHNASGGCFGTSKEMQQVADSLNQVNEVLKDIYESNSNLSREQITDFMNNETFFTSAQCLEYGICDMVIDGEDEESHNMLDTSIEDKTVYENKTVETVFSNAQVEDVNEDVKPQEKNNIKAVLKDFLKGE